jgi:hypothetical protein
MAEREPGVLGEEPLNSLPEYQRNFDFGFNPVFAGKRGGGGQKRIYNEGEVVSTPFVNKLRAPDGFHWEDYGGDGRSWVLRSNDQPIVMEQSARQLPLLLVPRKK